MKPGKRITQWNKYRADLKIIYQKKGITTCELRFKDCWFNNALSFAHHHKRSWYLDKPELLGSFNETILCCTSCHQKIEYDYELTKMVFTKLRP
jgi:hypothetical protein